MQINFDSETPIYMQIAEQIEDAILSGAFAEESQVPSTTEISVTYQINPATVLKGMNLLVDAGVLYKKRGLGMFVCKGAANGILQKRKKTFYDGFVVRLLQEAEKLSISRQELLEMIREGDQNESNPSTGSDHALR